MNLVRRGPVPIMRLGQESEPRTMREFLTELASQNVAYRAPLHGPNSRAFSEAEAALAGREDVARFVARVRAMGPLCEALVFVNPVAAHWPPDTPCGYAVHVRLSHTDYSCILSLNDGGRTVGEALERADAYLRRFVQDLVASPTFDYH